MMKNLRIVSAAAAALLAVAPVAASAVNVNADVTVNGVTSSDDTHAKADGTVKVDLSLDASAGTDVKKAEQSVKVTVNGATLGTLAEKNGDIEIGKVKNGKFTEATGDLKAGTHYVIQITNFKLTGLTTGKTYALDGGKVTAPVNKNGSYNASALDGAKLVFTSDSFNVYKTDTTGTVSFVNDKSTIVSNGSVELGKINTVSALAGAKSYTVSALAGEITKSYRPTVANGNATVDWNTSAVEKAVKKALVDNKVDVKKDGSFETPKSSFKVSVPAIADNGQKGNFEVTVNVNTKTSTAPVFAEPKKVDDVDLKSAGNDKFELVLPKPDATLTTASIANGFSAEYASSNGNKYNAPVSVKSSNLNAAVVGKYSVVLTATNPTTKVSKDVTINVTIGNPGETKTVQAGSETAKIVNITGDSVSESSDVLANGAKVSTFGTVTVKGVSYTRLNSEYSTQYVETKYVDGSIKEETTKSAKVMYKSAVYDKDGKSTGKTIGGYKDKDFVTTSNGDLKVVEIKGGNFYQLAKGEGYVRVRNVTGSKMTLKHNAYVYKSNGKRANKKVYKKGSTVTVYGGQYKAIKKYKGKAVRIGVNRYVKVANVNYKLAK